MTRKIKSQFTRKQKINIIGNWKAVAQRKAIAREMILEAKKEIANDRPKVSAVRLQLENPTLKLQKDKSGSVYVQPRGEKGKFLARQFAG